MSKWQPIETAPKDGSYIMILFDGEHRVVSWVEPIKGARIWHWAERDQIEPSFNPALVTHWMPLPEPPQSSDS
jgi:hypothetical protein